MLGAGEMTWFPKNISRLLVKRRLESGNLSGLLRAREPSGTQDRLHYGFRFLCLGLGAEQCQKHSTI